MIVFATDEIDIQNIGIERRIGRRRKVSNKQKQQKTTWTGVSKLVYVQSHLQL
jgi:hypothetical protein